MSVVLTAVTYGIGVSLFQKNGHKEPAKIQPILVDKPENISVSDSNSSDYTHASNSKTSLTKISTEYLIRYEQVNENPAYSSLDSRYQEIISRRPNAFSNVEELMTAIDEDSAWELTNQLAEAQWLLDNLNIEDPELMQFNSAKIESLVIGDVVELPIKQAGETYRLRIESVQADSDENITWRGHILHNNKNYYASITRNNSGLTIGGIDTPNGHYTLEAHGDSGWISTSHSAFHDASGPDFVTPRFD